MNQKTPKIPSIARPQPLDFQTQTVLCHDYMTTDTSSIPLSYHLSLHPIHLYMQKSFLQPLYLIPCPNSPNHQRPHIQPAVHRPCTPIPIYISARLPALFKDTTLPYPTPAGLLCIPLTLHRPRSHIGV